MAILIRNARVLTFDAMHSEFARADVPVSGPKIVAVGPNLDIREQPDVEIIDGSGKLVMPGLINAHLHSPGNFLKGAMDDLPLEFFMLYEVPPMGDTPLSARLYYLRAMLGAMEMLKLGVTSVHDDAFFNPLPLPETIDAIMTAYCDAGIRARVAIDQPNLVEYEKFPFLADLLPEPVKQAMRQAPIQSGAELIALYRDFVARWHGAAEGRLLCSTSCSAPEGGPAYVSTPADVVAATPKVVETIARAVHELGREPDGCLIACFGEPGLLEARRRFTFPIVGMAEASMLTAMQMGEKFAVLTLGEHWPTMLQDLVKRYGVQDRCAGITRVDGTPLELLNNPAQAAKAVAAAARECGAKTVIIGGAALTGLAATIGPLPGIQLIDCLLASIAQMLALTAYRRMR